MKNFEEIYKINVNDKTEKKNGLTYLSWAYAWAEFKKIYPDANYKIKRFEHDMPFIKDETGYMVFTEVTANELTYEMWLPVMDNRNKAILQPTMTDINKAIMRCLTKNLAMFGLGLYIYAGEDLPEEEGEKTHKKEMPFEEEHKKQMTLEEARAVGFVSKGRQYFIATMTEQQLLAMKDCKNPKIVEASRIELEARANNK